MVLHRQGFRTREGCEAHYSVADAAVAALSSQLVSPPATLFLCDCVAARGRDAIYIHTSADCAGLNYQLGAPKANRNQSWMGYILFVAEDQLIKDNVDVPITRSAMSMISSMRARALLSSGCRRACRIPCPAGRIHQGSRRRRRRRGGIALRGRTRRSRCRRSDGLKT